MTIAPEKLAEQNELRARLGLELVPEENTMLRCSICREWKPDENFYHRKDRPRRRFRGTECRPCHALRRAANREKNARPCLDCDNKVIDESAKRCRTCAARRATRVLTGRKYVRCSLCMKFVRWIQDESERPLRSYCGKCETS